MLTYTEEMKEVINVPEGLDVKMEGNSLVVSKGQRSNERVFFHPQIRISVNGRIITLEAKTDNRKLLKMVNTFKAHINNMINGLVKPFVYNLRICASHFPINVKVEGKNIIISNFLGEKLPRKAKIMGECEVKVEGETITVVSHNIEHAGQTAASIESATKITKRDRRIFQDGIYIIKKPGRK